MHAGDQETNQWYLETPVLWRRYVKIGLLIGTICALTTLLLFLTGTITIPKKEYFLQVVLFSSTAIFAFCSVLGGSIASAFLEATEIKIEKHTLLFDAFGKIILQVSANTKLWEKRWQELCRFFTVVEYQPSTIGIGMKCEPITDNPKVRRINFTVSAEVFKSPEEFADQRRRFRTKTVQETEEAARKALASQLYDFAEQHSRALAEFFNPLRKEQQAKFRDLVFNFLQPFAAEHKLTLTAASFGLM